MHFWIIISRSTAEPACRQFQQNDKARILLWLQSTAMHKRLRAVKLCRGGLLIATYFVALV
jgi:hypothetical protein